MFLSKYDTVEKTIQKAIFQPKYLFTPLASNNSIFGAYSYTGIYIFGIRIILIHTNF